MASVGGFARWLRLVVVWSAVHPWRRCARGGGAPVAVVRPWRWCARGGGAPVAAARLAAVGPAAVGPAAVRPVAVWSVVVGRRGVRRWRCVRWRCVRRHCGRWRWVGGTSGDCVGGGGVVGGPQSEVRTTAHSGRLRLGPHSRSTASLAPTRQRSKVPPTTCRRCNAATPTSCRRLNAPAPTSSTSGRAGGDESERYELSCANESVGVRPRVRQRVGWRVGSGAPASHYEGFGLGWASESVGVWTLRGFGGGWVGELRGRLGAARWCGRFRGWG